MFNNQPVRRARVNQRAVPNFQQQNHPPQPPPQPSEENITAVSEMGFTRQQAIFALQMSNNNVQLATNLLLGN